MFGATSSELPQRIAFILVPNFSMIAFTSAVEPLRLANRTAGKGLYSWRLFSGDGKPVAASNGIVLHPNGDIDQTVGYGTAGRTCGFTIQKTKSFFNYATQTRKYTPGHGMSP